MNELIRRFYEDVWNRWDDAAVDEVLHEGFTSRGSLGTKTVGRGGWREYRDVVRAGAHDFHNEVITMVIEGRNAAARLRYTGTQSGPLAGCEPTGRRFSYDGAAFFTSDGAALTSAWVFGDLSGLRAQLSGESDAGPRG